MSIFPVVELLAGIEGCGNMPFGSSLIFVVSFWSYHVCGSIYFCCKLLIHMAML
jgi:hypothetical protein